MEKVTIFPDGPAVNNVSPALKAFPINNQAKRFTLAGILQMSFIFILVNNIVNNTANTG